MKVINLQQLNRYIKRALVINFPEALWIKAEVLQIKEVNGNVYLTLIQHGLQEDKIVAQIDAIFWRKDKVQLEKKHKFNYQDILKTGSESALLVEIHFDEIYGLSLFIKDVDLDFTIGQLEKKKKETIAKIESLGLHQKNKALPMPKFISRIAVISSEKASGYLDFREHLIHNNYGYTFDIQLFSNRMQGQNVLDDLEKNMNKLTLQTSEFDVLVMIRGGGSKLDLSAFDEFEIAVLIADSPLPVLSGIGHETDTTVVDFVAHKYLKTPTAVAHFIIELNRQIDLQLDHAMQAILDKANALLLRKSMSADHLAMMVNQHARQLCQFKHSRLITIRERSEWLQQNLVRSKIRQIDQLFHYIVKQSPEEIMKKGYAFVKKGDKIVRNINDIQSGDELTTSLSNGSFQSIVK